MSTSYNRILLGSPLKKQRYYLIDKCITYYCFDNPGPAQTKSCGCGCGCALYDGRLSDPTPVHL